MANDDKNSVLTRIRDWFTPDKPDQPADPDADADADTTNVSYLRILLLLRQIPFRKLGPLVFTVPTIVFLAISGAVAWLAVGFGIVIRIIRLISGL